MKKFRRISTLALTLVLICTLAATAFAVSIESDSAETDFGNLHLKVTLEVADTEIKATTTISRVVSDSTGTADVGMTYTYCREDQVRPSYYQTGRHSGTLFVDGNSRTASLTKDVGSGYVVIDATAQFVVDVTTQNVTAEYAPNPLHVDYY
jgi:hypothetical protein